MRTTSLPGVLVLEPSVFADERGFFLESWNQRSVDAAFGEPVRFVQDNQARSVHGVVRGLHYQTKHPQGKLIRVTAGRVFDVAVDMRRWSPDLGKWVGIELSEENHRQLWIPPGFAHGYLVLSDYADSIYKTTEHHAPEWECALAWDDPHVGIEWPVHALCRPPLLSPRDRAAPRWEECELFGE